MVMTSIAQPSPLTTKGDLWGYSTGNTRLPVGTDAYLLSADSTQPTGLKYVASTSVSGVSRIDQKSVTAATAPSIVFTGIPATYSNLLVTWKARGDAGEVDLLVRFNTDATANYDWATWLLSRTSAAGATSIALTACVAASTLTAGRFAAGDFRVIDYTSAATQRQLVGQFARADGNVDDIYPGMVIGSWRNAAAAVSSITLVPSSGNLVTGSVATLYGLL